MTKVWLRKIRSTEITSSQQQQVCRVQVEVWKTGFRHHFSCGLSNKVARSAKGFDKLLYRSSVRSRASAPASVLVWLCFEPRESEKSGKTAMCMQENFVTRPLLACSKRSPWASLPLGLNFEENTTSQFFRSVLNFSKSRVTQWKYTH